MKGIIFIFLFCFFTLVKASAQKKDKKLQHQIEEAIKDFHGEIGVYEKT